MQPGSDPVPSRSCSGALGRLGDGCMQQRQGEEGSALNEPQPARRPGLRSCHRLFGYQLAERVPGSVGSACPEGRRPPLCPPWYLGQRYGAAGRRSHTWSG